MFGLIALLLSFALVIAGYASARRFVRDRLRYVDAAHRRSTPWVAGIGALLLGIVAAKLLPLIGIGTAVSFAFAIGSGVAAGSRDLRRATGGYLGTGQ